MRHFEDESVTRDTIENGSIDYNNQEIVYGDKEEKPEKYRLGTIGNVILKETKR